VGSAREYILKKMETLFDDAKWRIPDDFMQRSHFERVVRTKLDWTSSPGYPYMRRATTNGDFFACVDGEPSTKMLDFVWNLLVDRLGSRDSDPIRLFVKPEPHKQKKLDQGRYRLISSVSVVDQIIDHMLFADMNQQMVDNWLYVPSKVGWAPVNGGHRIIPKQKWMALDKSAWDWTVQPWLCEMVLETRMRLCENLSGEWIDLAQWRYVELFVAPVFITSGGWRMRQAQPGVMKSGCVNTITDNSLMQVILHLRVSMELGLVPSPIYTMGDDTLQQPVPDMQKYVDAMSAFSIVKEAALQNEFAGNRFIGRRIEPMYKGKHAYTLLHLNPEILPQLANSYVLLYHRSIYRDLMEDVFLKMGQDYHSRAFRDAIFDGC